MRHDDKIELFMTQKGYDESFNPTVKKERITTSCCKIHGNPVAAKIKSADGSDYVYAYQVVMFTPEVLPEINDTVRITKRDESIFEKEMRVKGCGTTRNKTSIFL